MKKVLTSIIIIISIHTFSQDDIKHVNIGDFFNATKVEENHFFVNDIIQRLNFEIFEEIKTSEESKKYTIAEKKFLLKLKPDSIFIESIKENLSNEIKSSLKESLVLEINEDFIENLIVKLYFENNKIEEIISNDSKNYTNKNIELYRNFSDLENKLLITYILDKNKILQIGNSIFPYLNKILKTDVEKTLNTSLNLLAVNF